MAVSELLDMVIGGLNITLAVVLLRGLGQYGRAFLWLWPLCGYFILRGVDRLYTALAVGTLPDWAEESFDALLVVALVLLVAGISKLGSGLRAVELDAAYASGEYQRALNDYRQLVRHRIANPLTAVVGGIETLLDLELDRRTQCEVLRAMQAKAHELQSVALDPQRLSEVERELDAVPQPHRAGSVDTTEDR